MLRSYWVYILTNTNNTTLYIGVTNNLERRLYEHQHKLVKGFSEKYHLTKLVHCEEYENIEEALSREKQLKNWKRQWKEELINKVNPKWKDLSKNNE